MAETPPLTEEQTEAAQGFLLAIDQLGHAMSALEAAGLDVVSALRSMPGPDGGTAYDALPLQARLLLG